MSAKRYSLLLNTKGLSLSFANLLSFAVSGELYLAGHISGLLHELTDNNIIGPLKWPPMCSELSL